MVRSPESSRLARMRSNLIAILRDINGANFEAKFIRDPLLALAHICYSIRYVHWVIGVVVFGDLNDLKPFLKIRKFWLKCGWK